MMTGLMFHHQQQQQQQQPQTVVAENRSNLTVSASGETTVSIHNHQQYLAPPSSSTTTSSQSQPVRKKRNLPGNPDPDAEVIALSPKTLLATNRFICEICNKGFQRDQNLQLHRRGHNLPWKLKQRGTSKEATRKKVYVCPEPACVHHAPARALGDLTGIKKHYSRKHGEKKWKCDKCSKKYAVQSDWKAHSKTCGTREYRCDCGTLFSRRDSFITHRAFCDALAEESARAANPLMLPPSQLQPPQPHLLNNNLNNLQTQTLNHHLHTSLKKEHHILPPWLEPPTTTTTTIDHHRRGGDGHVTMSLLLHENPNPNPTYHLPPPSPHMSATALLQRAAQMGATISKTGSVLLRTHPHQQQHQSHVTASPAFNLSPGADHVTMSMTTTSTFPHAHGGFFPPDDDGRFEGGHHSFDGAFIDGNIFNSKKDGNLHGGGASKNGGSGGGSGGGGGGSEGLTRDFLGLRPLSHSDILGIAGIGSCLSSSHDQQNYQSQKPWQG